MAESKGNRRYGHGPKIADKGSKSMGTEHEDTKPARETKGAAPKGDEISGTERTEGERRVPEEGGPPKESGMDGQAHGMVAHEMPTHERHYAERKEMHDRHHKELTAMHDRHAEENKKMNTRHEKELATAPPQAEAA